MSEDAIKKRVVQAYEDMVRAMNDALIIESSGIFRDHICWRCHDGSEPCVRGNPRDCEYLHARND